MTKTHNYPSIKMGDFKKQIAAFPDHYDLDFSGLTFYRLNRQSETSIQVEFEEVVYRTLEGTLVVQNLAR